MKQEVFGKLPYVTKRYNKYGIRVRVPDEVRAIIDKKEITRSLGTGDPDKAKLIYHEKLKEVLEEIEAAKKLVAGAEAPLLTSEMAEVFITKHFQQVIYDNENFAHRAQNNIGAIEIDDDTLINKTELHLEISLDLRDARAEGEVYAKGIADAILLENGFPEIIIPPSSSMPKPLRRRTRKRVHVDRASSGYTSLLRLSFEGQIEVWERMIAILEGREYDVAKSLFPNVRNPISRQQISSNLQLQSKPSNGSSNVSLCEVFDSFIEAHPNKSKRWKLDMRTSFACLLDFKGSDINANTLIKRDFRELLGFVRSMPTQIGNNKKKWKGMSLREIVAVTAQENDIEENLLHPTTVNKYMGRISQVMQWAADEPLIDHNHAQGVRIPADEIEDLPDRDPFSYSQLNALFSCEPFTSPNEEEPSLYWACILSLFHGFRSEEILQLRASDVLQDDDGIWFLDIHRRGDNNLKKKSAARTIPIHPFIFELGFT